MLNKYNALNVHIVVNGCHENRMDAALLERFLKEKYKIIICDQFTKADFIIVLGCSVTQHMEDESKDIINYLKINKNPHSKLYVLGCISKLRPEIRTGEFEEFFPYDEIEELFNMGIEAKRLAINKPYECSKEIIDIVSKRKVKVFKSYLDTNVLGGKYSSLFFGPSFTILKLYKDYLERNLHIYNDNTYCIKISTGCLGECSYCSIKKSRGKIKSKTEKEVMLEFEKGLIGGYRDFTLLGTDIGDYGRDVGCNLIVILEKIVKLKHKLTLRLRNVNPRFLKIYYKDLCSLIKSKKIIYIQSPIQSGNDRILSIMKRGYEANNFLMAAREIKKNFSEIVLRTQIIVGFPTETDMEFKDSLAVVRSGLFDYVDIFRYTRRNVAESCQIRPEVPFDIIMQRYKVLLIYTLFRNPIRKLRVIRRLKRV